MSSSMIAVSLLIVSAVFIILDIYRRIAQIGIRIDKLSRDDHMSVAPTPFIKERSPAVTTAVPAETHSVVVQKQQEPSPKKASRNTFTHWLFEDWIFKLGALLVLIAVSWFATYAFANHWIGPVGAVTMSIVLGAILLPVGWWRMREYRNQGAVLIALGNATMTIALFVSNELYHIFPRYVDFGVLFFTAIFVAWVSLHYRYKPLIFLSLFIASVLPTLTMNISDISLFTYLLILVLGVIWIAFITHWQGVVAATLGIAFLYSLIYFSGDQNIVHVGAAKGIILIFGYIFTLVFFVSGIASIARKHKNNIVASVVLAVGTGFFLMLWIVHSVSQEWQTVTIIAWACVWGIGSFLVFRITRIAQSFYIYFLVSVGMIVFATIQEIAGPLLVVVYVVEMMLLSVSAYLLSRDVDIAGNISIFTFGAVPFGLQYLSENLWYMQTSLIHENSFVLLTFGSVLLFLSIFLWYIDTTKTHNKLVRTACVYTGSFFIYALFWRVIYAIGAIYSIAEWDPIAISIILLTYTIISVSVYMYGLTIANKYIQRYGSVGILFIVGRLLFVDVWYMPLGIRIFMLFCIGILCMSTAFFARKKVMQLVSH